MMKQCSQLALQITKRVFQMTRALSMHNQISEYWQIVSTKSSRIATVSQKLHSNSSDFAIVTASSALGSVGTLSALGFFGTLGAFGICRPLATPISTAFSFFGTLGAFAIIGPLATSISTASGLFRTLSVSCTFGAFTISGPPASTAAGASRALRALRALLRALRALRTFWGTCFSESTVIVILTSKSISRHTSKEKEDQRQQKAIHCRVS
mmetsp:Transcript_29452/g.61097  ORF Transcript_29452/g.61097 Transcript_29452/m.61097 type:complete len:211 (+) Transcript_29452:113-745(+)